MRAWCREHVPARLAAAQTGVTDEEFVAFQKAWFAGAARRGLRRARTGRREWGGGMSVAEQIVLYQELAAHDAPRLVLAFVGIHHAASTLLVAGTDEQRQPAPAGDPRRARSGARASPSPRPAPTSPACETTARREGDGFVVNGQKVWASGALHADWCLLLARTDPDAPKRHGISYFLMDMALAGHRRAAHAQATGESHFCEIFLNDVVIPAANLVGAENAGWQVAQATLGAERGHDDARAGRAPGQRRFRWLVDDCPRPGGERPIDDPVVADRLAQFETEMTGLRGAVPRRGGAR